MGLFDWLVGNADKELEMITALTYVAASDGKFDVAESVVIDRFCSGMGFTGISQSTMKKGIERAVEGLKPDFTKFSDKEKRQLLKACGRVAAADGDMHDDERNVVVALAGLMGYGRDEALGILDGE